MTGTRSRRVLVLFLGVAWLAAADVMAEEAGPPRDVDLWHEAFAQAVGGSLVDEVRGGWTLGLYPTVGVAAGPPNWAAYQLGGYLSLANEGKFSLFAGYGYERGPTSLSHMVTLGWGGVRRLSAARPQRGFYGKFFRYRYLEDFTHGVHHGLSIGTETGAGVFGMAFEVGVARSQNNHWSFTAQVAVKLAVPILIRLSGEPGA